MSKSYKLNGGHIDSTGIVHNRDLLSAILNYTLKKCSALTYETNFNNVLEPGYYIYNGWSGNNTGSNRPSDTRAMGFLIVLSHPAWGNYMQIYFCSNSSIGIKYRMYSDGSWKNWLSVSVS